MDLLAAGTEPRLDPPRFVSAHTAVLSTWRLPAFVQSWWTERFPRRMAANPWLAAETWRRIWTGAAGYDEVTAARLVYRPLRPDLIKVVLSNEQRPGVLAALLDANGSDSVLRKVLTRVTGSGLAMGRIAGRHGPFNLQVVAEFAQDLPMPFRLEWVAWGPPELVSDRDVLDVLSSPSIWATLLAPEHVAHILERRPHLTEQAALMSLQVNIALMLADSRHLRSTSAQWSLLRLTQADAVFITLLNNPVCGQQVAARLVASRVKGIAHAAQRRATQGTLETSYETATEHWLPQLVTRRTSRRLGETLALLRNQAVSDDQVWELLDTLVSATGIIDDETREPTLDALVSTRPHLISRIHQAQDRIKPWFRPWFDHGGQAMRFRASRDSDAGLCADDIPASTNVWKFPISGPEWVAERLGRNMDAWDLFLGLVPTYHGPLVDCVEDARRLAR